MFKYYKKTLITKKLASITNNALNPLQSKVEWQDKLKTRLNIKELKTETKLLSIIDRYNTTALKGASGSGIKIELRGRLNSSGIASKQIFYQGKIPRQTFNQPIRQTKVGIRTKVGIIGLNVLTN